MIPKVIHYCWFGGKPLNALGEKCLASWKRYFPDFQIIEWNETNVDLNNCCQYVKEAYSERKWAFVSDYVRLKILYEHGGVYFDTDVEVIQSFQTILEHGPFMGCENADLHRGVSVNPGLGFAVEPRNSFIAEILEDYEKSSFYKDDGTLNLYTIVERTTNLLRQHGLMDTMDSQQVAGITIYPAEYFCPINMNTGKLEITSNTCSVHRFAASWESPQSRFRGKVYYMLCRFLGEKTAKALRSIWGR